MPYVLREDGCRVLREATTAGRVVRENLTIPTDAPGRLITVAAPDRTLTVAAPARTLTVETT